MFGMTDQHVIAVYNQMKDRYPLLLTNTMALNEGFTTDCPILVGRSHGKIMELYSDGGMFILDVMDEAQTKGTHYHPNGVESATEYIAEFMDGKSDYEMYPFKVE